MADVFAAQLGNGRDVGASVGVYLDGKPVVNIWGGSADPGRGVPWSEHTITPIGSTGKALASTALLILVDRGLVDLDEPVASYWPAFGQNGKDEIPVRLVLSHRSGVAALDVPISNDQAAALDPVLRLIEQQRPWWRPGAQHGYHAVTYGFILSGLIRAVTGRTVGEFFADEVARPLELDLYIGLPPESHDTVAPMIGPSQRQAIRSMLNPVWLRYLLGVANRRSASYRATFGGTSVSFDDHEELVRYEVEDASSGAVGNGPSLARMFSALIGDVDGRRLISTDLMNTARQPQAGGYASCFACGPTGDSASPFRADRCGLMSVFRGSSVTPAPAARWRLPTPNTDSRSVTRPTCGPSSPAPSARRSSGFRPSPKPSINAPVCVCGPTTDDDAAQRSSAMVAATCASSGCPSSTNLARSACR